ncbi:protein of unknown function [Moritella yayanosii]|uniref:Uncharacterized protein n=1 Tax=Moritella yayanosii TaxID=69539 RepID=A0A330LVC8_9GAMM|nr:protein of unknown function [Moritella yayanosii]
MKEISLVLRSNSHFYTSGLELSLFLAIFNPSKRLRKRFDGVNILAIAQF